jgi:hypothetical protein
MEVSIKTEVYLPMFTIVGLDGQHLQVIGYCGDYTTLEYIDFDTENVVSDFDWNSVTEFTE